MGLFDMLGGFATAGAQVYETGMNYKSQQETNAANIAMNEANNAQNMALTTGQWARDDNSVQRRVADMRAAGLNPVLAAGQGAQSSAPISMQAGRAIAPQMSGSSSAVGKGVEAYGALVQAKELKADREAANTARDAQSKINRLSVQYADNPFEEQVAKRREAQARADMVEHDRDYYKKTGLPTTAGQSEVNKVLQAREAMQTYARDHPGTLPGAILDLLGGTE